MVWRQTSCGGVDGEDRDGEGDDEMDFGSDDRSADLLLGDDEDQGSYH